MDAQIADATVAADQAHVVLGESGEYSDRDVWVAGVFRSRDEAVAAAEAMEREAKAFDVLYDAWCQRGEAIERAEVQRLTAAGMIPTGRRGLYALSEADRKAAHARIGAQRGEPPEGRSGSFTVVSGPFGAWDTDD